MSNVKINKMVQEEVTKQMENIQKQNMMLGVAGLALAGTVTFLTNKHLIKKSIERDTQRLENEEKISRQLFQRISDALDVQENYYEEENYNESTDEENTKEWLEELSNK